MTATTLHISGTGATAFFLFEDPGTGTETAVFLALTETSLHAPPQRGGPETEQQVVLSLTQLNPETAEVLIVGDALWPLREGTPGEGRVDLELPSRGPGGFSAEVEGTLPLFNEASGDAWIAIDFDFSFEASGRAVREVFNERLVSPGDQVLVSNVRGFHAPATATGTLTFLGNTYPLATTNAEIFWDSTGIVTVGQPDWVF
jgi:hypothetical protein